MLYEFGSFTPFDPEQINLLELKKNNNKKTWKKDNNH